MKNPLTNSKGAAVLLIVLIIALVAAIILAIWAWGENGDAKHCLNTLQGPIMNYDKQWQASKASGAPDVGICNQLNTFITNYNNRCGKKYGNLPLENCG